MTAEAEALADIVSLDRERRLRSDKSVGPDPIVAHWSCRVVACNDKVGVGATAVFVLSILNEELKRRRDRIIETNECVFCPYHAERWREQMRERRR